MGGPARALRPGGGHRLTPPPAAHPGRRAGGVFPAGGTGRRAAPLPDPHRPAALPRRARSASRTARSRTAWGKRAAAEAGDFGLPATACLEHATESGPAVRRRGKEGGGDVAVAPRDGSAPRDGLTRRRVASGARAAVQGGQQHRQCVPQFAVSVGPGVGAGVDVCGDRRVQGLEPGTEHPGLFRADGFGGDHVVVGEHDPFLGARDARIGPLSVERSGSPSPEAR